MIRKKLLVSFSTIALHAIAFAQVQLHTGAAQISIPLYSYTNEGNRIGTAISLDYISGNGLKVNEMASSVGTGWELNFGGVITRIQHGEPDDQKNGGALSASDLNEYTSSYNQNYFPNGYLYSEFDPSVAVDDGGIFSQIVAPGGNFLPRKKYLADREQDEFSFAFNGQKGFFFIGKNGEILTTTHSRLKIDFDTSNMWPSGIRTKIGSFQITDANGIKYIFKDLELAEVVKYDQSYHDLKYGRGTGQFVVSKWHLTEIINPLTNGKITFTYDTYDVDLNTTQSIQKSTFSNGSTALSRVWFKTKGKAKRVKSINCSNIEKIEFKYQDVFRADFLSDRSLSSVIVKYNDAIEYTWNFSYGYFMNSSILSSTDPILSDTTYTRAVRLCLLTLQKTGSGISEPPYRFDYNLNHRVPNMFTYYHDNWGYANNDSRWDTEGAYDEWYNLAGESQLWQKKSAPLENPNLYRGIADGYAATGIIKSISYPLGGKLTFEYEQNSSIDPLNVVHPTGGVRVAKTKLFDGVSHDNDIITEYKYVRDNSTTTSGRGYEAFTYSRQYTVRMFPVSENRRISGIVPSTASSMHAIRTQNGTGNVFSHGPSIEFQLVMAIINKVLGDVFKDMLQPLSTDVTFDIAYSDALNANDLLPLIYNRVEVIPRTGNTTNGKTINEFTYESVSQEPFYPYSGKQRYPHWEFGLPQRIWVYDKDNKPLKHVEYEYDYISTDLTNNINYWNQKWAPKTFVYDDFDDFTQYQAGNFMNIASDNYFPLVGRAQLKKTLEYTFNGNSLQSLITTDYAYVSENYQIRSITTTNSKGEAVQTSTLYPEDFPATGVNATMRRNNIVNMPIARQVEIERNGGSYIISGDVTEFGFAGNGDIRPVKNYMLESDQPIDKSIVGISPNSPTINTQYYKEQQHITYNSNGLVEQVKAKNRKIGKLYGYDNNHLVAEIIGAGGDEAFFDSFEEVGNWNGISYDNTKVRSGKYSGRIDNYTGTPKYLYSSKVVELNNTQDKKYRFSGWVYNEVTPVSTIVLFYSTDLVNYQVGNFLTTTVKDKWVFLEGECLIPSNAKRLVLRIDNNGAGAGGTAWFDDLRLVPSNARMTTFTYEPLIGTTSQSDANNRTVFYEYDGLGRLIHVLDDDRNILKKYCYTFTGQLETCPPLTVGNEVRTRTITKNDCNAPGGYYGTPVTYTVPANRYFGLTQQAANALADAEIDREGQAFSNLNGTCNPGATNVQKSGTFTTSCPNGKIGSQVTYIVPAGKYAAVDQVAANLLADQDVQNNGQAYANEHGSCLYYSSAVSGNYYSQACAPNQTAVPYLVSIPAGTYFSSISKDIADGQAQQAAQAQANQNGQCSNNPTTIYARLEVELTESNQSSSYNSYYGADEDYYYQWVSVYLRFYSDAACTQALVLPQNVSYSVQQSGWFETESSFQYASGSLWQGTAQAGVSEVYFDNSLPFEYLWAIYDSNGYIMLEKARDDYSVTSIGTNCTLRPVIYPQHTVPFQ